MAPLVDIVLNTTNPNLLIHVAGVLRNLATNVGIASEICKLNCIPKLLSYLAPSADEASEEVRTPKRGAADSSGGSSTTATTSSQRQSEVIHVLMNISSHDENRVFLIDNNVLPAVIPLLNSPSPEIAAAATELIMHLSHAGSWFVSPSIHASMHPCIQIRLHVLPA